MDFFNFKNYFRQRPVSFNFNEKKTVTVTEVVFVLDSTNIVFQNHKYNVAWK